MLFANRYEKYHYLIDKGAAASCYSERHGVSIHRQLDCLSNFTDRMIKYDVTTSYDKTSYGTEHRGPDDKQKASSITVTSYVRYGV